MTPTRTLPSLGELKTQAKRLRDSLARAGIPINHSRSLELLAHQLGYKDWNTLFAVTREPSSPLALGGRVSGEYLGQPFKAEVIGISRISAHPRYRITLKFDEPVDVVMFSSFSAFRQRVSCVVGGSGETSERTSNGRPHLRLAL